MLGHGQIEGFSEKYGMEYYRAYWDEIPDENLIRRHEREIFPLIKKRYLYADVENFALYNFYTNDGSIDENVFAYSNGKGNERSLVVLNNRFGSTQGSIKISTNIKRKDNDSGSFQMHSLDVFHGLNLHGQSNDYVIYRDVRTGLEYIKSSQSIKENGLNFSLEAYDYLVLIDFREVQNDDSNQYQRLEQYLNGRGVPNIHEAMHELTLAPILGPIRNLINSQTLKSLYSSLSNSPKEFYKDPSITHIFDLYQKMIQALQDHRHIDFPQPDSLNHFKKGLETIRLISIKEEELKAKRLAKYSLANNYLISGFSKSKNNFFILLLWLLLHNLGGYSKGNTSGEYSRSLIEEWNLTNYLENILVECGLGNEDAPRVIQAVKFIIAKQDWAINVFSNEPYSIVQNWLTDDQIRSFIGVNRYKDILWFNKESFDSLLWAMFAVSWSLSGSDLDKSLSSHIQDMILTFENIKKIKKAELKSEYQLTKLMDNLK
jgi:hypothetical protein